MREDYERRVFDGCVGVLQLLDSFLSFKKPFLIPMLHPMTVLFASVLLYSFCFIVVHDEGV